MLWWLVIVRLGVILFVGLGRFLVVLRSMFGKRGLVCLFFLLS